jgi:hypothetical protein
MSYGVPCRLLVRIYDFSDILKHIHSSGYTLWLQILGGKHFCDRCVKYYAFAYLQFKISLFISLVHKNPRTNNRIFVLKMSLDFLARSTFSADIFHLLPHISCHWTRTSLHEHDQFPCILLLYKSLSRILRTCTTAASAAQKYISWGPKITLSETTQIHSYLYHYGALISARNERNHILWYMHPNRHNS